MALNGTGARSLTLTGSNTGGNVFAPVLGDNGGPTSLIKTGTGTWVLTAANSYSGGTAINGGILEIASDTNLGAPTGPLNLDSGTLATTASFTSGRTTTLNSGGGTFDVAPATTLTLSGAIRGVGALTKADTGTLVLTGNNSYSGITNVAAGTLQAGATTAFSPNSAFDVAATLDLHGFSNTIGSLSGTGLVINSATAPAILTAGKNDASTTFSGTIQDGNGVLGLTKIGTGTLTLTGATLIRAARRSVQAHCRSAMAARPALATLPITEP